MKKNLIYYLFFCLMLLGSTNTFAQYCTTGVGPSSTADSNVDSIGLTGDAATVVSYQKVCSATRVEDLTATQSASVTVGSNYDLTVVFGTCGTTPYAGAGEVWIDWNQNEIFDPAESIGTWTGSPTDTSVFSFTPPASAFNGATRVRVMHQEGSTVTPPLNPCGSYTWGSVVDFNVVVSGGVVITCPNPSMLTAGNILPASADLSWMENGTATSWAIEYGAPNFTPGTGTIVPANSNPFTLTGLTDNTPYEYYVRAICGPGDSSIWTGPYPFVTPCLPTTAPFLETFATNSLPSCWMQMGANNWEYGSNVTNPTGFADYGADNVPDHSVGGSGTFIGMDGSDNTNGNRSTLLSPLVDINPLTTPQLSYWVFSNNVTDAAQNKLIVELYDGANWVVIDSIQSNLGPTWVEFTTDLTTLTISGNVQVRFTVTGDNTAGGFTYHNDILIDDVAFRNVPSCLIPSTLTSNNLTATSVDFGWTENGTATNWIVEYGAVNFTLGSGTSIATTTNPSNITGLMSNTTYDFYVRAVCGPGDSSTFVGPLTLTTPCAVFTPTYFTDFSTFLPGCWDEVAGGSPTTGLGTLGSGAWGQNGSSARINLYSDFTFDWLLSPEFDLSAGGWELVVNTSAIDFGFGATTFSGMGSDDSVQVVVSTDGGATWTPIYTWDAANQPNLTANDVIIDLSAYTGTSNLFGIWASEGATDDTEDYYVLVNDFEIRMPLSCSDPSLLTSANITATGLDFGWTENGTATSWQVTYGAPGAPAGSGMSMVVASNPASITGLMSNTSYDFYVRAICAPGDSSTWVGPLNITTLCPTSFTPAYFTDFSTFLPGCWDQAGDGSPATGPSTLGSSLWSQDGSSARINLYTTDRTDWLLSPNFDLSTGNWELVINASAIDFGFGATTFSGMGSDDSVQVVVSTDGGATWTPIYTWDAANPLTLTANDVTMDLSAYTGTSNLFGIWAADGPVDDTEDYYATINSFEIRAAAVVTTPANLVITEIMYNSPEGGIDSLEFVEIYNNGTTATDLTGYTLSGISYTFPAVTLPVGGYYVIGVNASAFNTVYGFPADGIATGGLSNSGEAVIIRTPMGMVVDSVRYDDGGIWDSSADGNGPSLILCDTASDNADGNNWSASATSTGVTINGNVVLASPGAANSCPAPLDVAVASFLNLDSVYCNVATITGSAIITNMSSTDATNVLYTVTADGNTVGGGTIALLAGNASDTITIGPVPATTGSANVVVTTTLTGDVNTSNDMLSMMVYLSNTSAAASIVTDISCNGDSTGVVTAVGSNGIGAYTYIWNADANLITDTLMNLPAGMYTVVVTDSVGCTDTAMVTLTDPTAIMLTDSVDNVLCNGDSTGMAMVTAMGGTPAYAYAWSNGATTDMNTNIAAGTYTVTVTDANGCMAMLTSTVAEPTPLDVTITDNGDGTAFATATGGTAGYSFLWDANAANQTTDTATALINNGAYTVTATDANGCTDTASVVITIVNVNNIASISNLKLFPNPTNANVFVELELVKNSNVQINITNSIGQLVINKELINVQSETIELNTSTLSSGIYMVQFTIGKEFITKKLIVNKQ